jgi:hypothetical protein
MKQFVITSSMGKRLIAKGIARHAAIGAVLKKGRLAIVAGTTNGYVAEEILAALGQSEGFSRMGFRRGMTVAPGFAAPQVAPTADVVIVDGQWLKAKEIFDVVDDMQAGDVILKGGNALDLCRSQAAALIAHPMGGSLAAAIPAVIGRRVRMIVPIGLEKRVCDDLGDLINLCNAPDAEGPRMMMIPGEVFTELDAIQLLAGASATLLAGGGIHGAEGAVWLGVSGPVPAIHAAEELIHSVSREPACQA